MVYKYIHCPRPVRGHWQKFTYVCKLVAFQAKQRRLQLLPNSATQCVVPGPLATPSVSLLCMFTGSGAGARARRGQGPWGPCKAKARGPWPGSLDPGAWCAWGQGSKAISYTPTSDSFAVTPSPADLSLRGVGTTRSQPPMVDLDRPRSTMVGHGQP